MTLIVGILCSDGVVMASDSAASYGTGHTMTIGQQETRKVFRINDGILMSSTGAMGISQLIADKIKACWEARQLSGRPAEVMQVLGLEINKLVRPYLETGNWLRAIGGDGASLCKAMVAMPVAQKPCLFQFDYNGAPEHATAELPHIALGSGQPIADPFLAFLKRLLWGTTQPTMAEGRLAAVWTIDHVSRTNPGGVGGAIQLASLAASGKDTPKVTLASKDDVNEHLQRVASAEAALVAELRLQTTTGGAPPLPATPPATAPKQAV